MTVALDHAGLSVADLDGAVGFYGRAFGFESEFAFDLPHEIIVGAENTASCIGGKDSQVEIAKPCLP